MIYLNLQIKKSKLSVVFLLLLFPSSFKMTEELVENNCVLLLAEASRITHWEIKSKSKEGLFWWSSEVLCGNLKAEEAQACSHMLFASVWSAGERPHRRHRRGGVGGADVPVSWGAASQELSSCDGARQTRQRVSKTGLQVRQTPVAGPQGEANPASNIYKKGGCLSNKSIMVDQRIITMPFLAGNQLDFKGLDTRRTNSFDNLNKRFKKRCNKRLTVLEKSQEKDPSRSCH